MNGIHIFTLAKVPVLISPWYVLVLGYLSLGAGWEAGIAWAVSVTLSILVHEFGHAAMARRYRLSPRIILHGWGGLTAHERARGDREDALIIIAGPLCGLALGAIVYGFRSAAGDLLIDSPHVSMFVQNLIHINFFWSLANLIPLWPLDGGQLFRLGMLRVHKNPEKAERVTHLVGLILGGSIALAGHFWLESKFIVVLAALLALQNATRIGSKTSSGPIRSQNHFGNELLHEAKEAFAKKDYREAARLAHQIRADSRIEGKALAETWEILALATTELGEWEDAIDYLKYAPDTEATRNARAKCEASLVGKQSRD